MARPETQTNMWPPSSRRRRWCCTLANVLLLSSTECFELRHVPRKRPGRSLLELASAVQDDGSTFLIDAIEGTVVPNQKDRIPDSSVGLYVHWPFCRRRCRYCDFAIVPIGVKKNDAVASEQPSQLDLDYTRALLEELKHEETKLIGTSPLRIQSIYFGGGTPSLAPIESLASVLDFIRSSAAFHVEMDCETTIEVDPGTFTLPKLVQLKQLGFNRLSFGVQSFDDVTLSLIGRTHRLADIEASLNMIRQVYSDQEGLNWSIDLISGLPGVSLAKWIETLEVAVSLQPPPTHISVYDLQVEQGTVFDSWYNDDNAKEAMQRTRLQDKASEAALPSPEDAAFMYKYASGYLKAHGYEHYEVSSYALQETSSSDATMSFRSRHNQIYWAVDGRWLAFGLGASSYDGSFVVRPRELSNYIDWVENLISSPLPLSTSNENADDGFERLTDIVLKRLRTSDGLSLFEIRDRFGNKFFEAILRGAELALSLNLASYDATSGCLKLKDPDGFLFSNTIISSIFVELEQASEVDR